MEKKSNHQANVVRVSEILPHTNADSLELIHIGGYQVVVKKGQFQVGDLAVYVQPDSVVPQTEPFRFIWEPYIDHTSVLDFVSWDGQHGREVHCKGINGEEIEIPERRRRITVRRFRKEWSEGLLLRVSDFPQFESVNEYILTSDTPLPIAETQSTSITIREGSDVSDLLGITHYDPDRGRESTKGDNEAGPGNKSRWPRSFKGWLYFLLYKLGFKVNGVTHGWDRENVDLSLPVYDVDAYKNFQNAFQPDEPVVVTEKIHGSNARYVFLDGKMYAGSRTLWKSPKSTCIWRKALAQHSWIDEWCRAHPGYALYGEVVPTQKGFDYGCKDGETKFFVFDIRTPEGAWDEPFRSDGMSPLLSDLMMLGGASVPLIGVEPFNADKLQADVDGKSRVISANHIREGIVVKPITERHIHGLGRLILKLVSNAFLEKDSK